MIKIEWTDKTWNPVAARHRTKIVERNLEHPLYWRKPLKIFVCSMTDLFGEFVSFDLIDKVFAVMALCPQHTFQVLTKRPEMALEWNITSHFDRRLEIVQEAAARVRDDPAINDWNWPLPNVWIGVTAEDQQRANERIPKLIQIPAAKRFVSYEPALGPVNLGKLNHENLVGVDALNGTHGFLEPHEGRNDSLDWVICGGESGPGARPMHPDWARSVRDQCQEAGVPFFFKQWGEHEPYEEKGDGNLVPASDPRDLKKFFEGADVEHGKGGWFWSLGSDIAYRRVGKRAAGRLLDGREHMEFPA